jgi:hypothetical protein
MYRKHHIGHYLLIYGFDLIAREFLAMEHYYLNSARYRETRIPFAVVEEAFTHMNEVQTRSPRLLVSLRQVAGLKTESAPRIATDISAALTKSLASMELVLRHITDALRDRALFEQNSACILDFLGKLRAKKQGQKDYFMSVLGKESALYRLLDRVYEDYVFLYGGVLKMKLTGRQDAVLAEKMQNRIAEIEEHEAEIHRLLQAYYKEKSV